MQEAIKYINIRWFLVVMVVMRRKRYKEGREHPNARFKLIKV